MDISIKLVAGVAIMCTFTLPAMASDNDALNNKTAVSSSGGRSYVPEIVLGAVGVAALVTGGVLYGEAIAAESRGEERVAGLVTNTQTTPCDYKSNAEPCALLVEDAEDAYVLSGAGIGMWVLGGAALTAGTVHLLVVGSGDSSAIKASALRVSPLVGAVNGFQLSGSF